MRAGAEDAFREELAARGETTEANSGLSSAVRCVWSAVFADQTHLATGGASPEGGRDPAGRSGS